MFYAVMVTTSTHLYVCGKNCDLIIIPGFIIQWILLTFLKELIYYKNVFIQINIFFLILENWRILTIRLYIFMFWYIFMSWTHFCMKLNSTFQWFVSAVLLCVSIVPSCTTNRTFETSEFQAHNSSTFIFHWMRSIYVMWFAIIFAESANLIIDEIMERNLRAKWWFFLTSKWYDITFSFEFERKKSFSRFSNESRCRSPFGCAWNVFTSGSVWNWVEFG